MVGFAARDVLFPVIPSEGAVIAAGVFAASAGGPNLPLVMAVAAAGAFVGDHIAYGIGRSVLGPRAGPPARSDCGRRSTRSPGSWTNGAER